MEEKFEKLKRYMNYFVDTVAFSYSSHLRIVTDAPIPFPKNYELIGHRNDIELSEVKWNKHPNKGWSKPDIEFKGIEIRYLWKQFKPIPFEIWNG